MDYFHELEDEYFDVMLQYGDVDTYEIVREGYQKYGSSFTDTRYTRIGTTSVDGYFWSIITNILILQPTVVIQRDLVKYLVDFTVRVVGKLY